jgi:hypothetical protein
MGKTKDQAKIQFQMYLQSQSSAPDFESGKQINEQMWLPNESSKNGQKEDCVTRD